MEDAECETSHTATGVRAVDSETSGPQDTNGLQEQAGAAASAAAPRPPVPTISISGPIAAPTPRGAAELSARTKQMANTKLPPSLKAKLEAVRTC